MNPAATAAILWAMETCVLHDKTEIESFLRKNIYLHIYGIGDLDDFFWHKTIWYGWTEDGEIREVVLIYTEPPLPTLHAMSEDPAVMAELLESILHLLPRKFHAHLSPGLAEVFDGRGRVESIREHYKMALKDTSRIEDVDCSQVVRLTENDLDDMLELYRQSYPQNWFDPRMLQTGQYFGIRAGGKLLSIAGIHVYSPQYKVAALGNIVTHPAHRNSGLARATTAKLCQSLSETITHIGLNVKADNTAAISLYKKLGFEIITPYHECMIATN